MRRRRDPAGTVPRSLTLVLVAGLSLVACGQLDARVVRLGTALPALPADTPVRVYHAPLPPLNAREIALVEVTRYTDASFDEMVAPLREIARSVGANAVVWLRVDRASGFYRIVASALRVAP